MLLDEKTDAITLIKSHFHKATEGDAELAWDHLKGFEFRDVKRAVEEHHVEKGDRAWRPDLKRITFLAATYRNSRRRVLNDRIVDVVRRDASASGDGRFGPDEDDRTVLMLHFAEAWEGVKVSNAPEMGRNAARAYLLNHGRMAFAQIGMSQEDADAHARDCVELKPGEKIPRKPLFQKMPEAPKSWDALKSLAVHENERQPAELGEMEK